MTVKRVPHKLFATLAEAQRFASWVDARLGLPSGSRRARTLTHARIETHPLGTSWAYPVTPIVARLLSDERALTRTAQELLAEPVLATVRTADEAEPDYSAWRRTP
jgi:hypothetical protein